MDVTSMKIRDMRKMLDSKEISAAELTTTYLERIKGIDPEVKELYYRNRGYCS